MKSPFSLRNKIFFTFLVVTFALSVIIAFLARWILVSSLTEELEQRGSAIAHSIAEHARSYVLDEEYPKLLNLIAEEVRLGEREELVAYIFIADRDNNVVSNTFFRPFPGSLRTANLLNPGVDKSVLELNVDGQVTYDIAVPIKEGLYRVGTVHVGLSKSHMDNLISKLRNTFLFFIVLFTVLLLVLTNYLSRKIVRPVTGLTQAADEVSRGNFDVQFETSGAEKWDPSQCPAYHNTSLPCWHFDQSKDQDQSEDKPYSCNPCKFYTKRLGDEVVQLEDSFRNMLWSIRLYRRRLRESEEKYRSLFDSAPDPTFVLGAENLEILDVNPRAVELYGYTREAFLGSSFTSLCPEHEKNLPMAAEFDQAVTGCVYQSKVVHYKKGGEPFFVNTHACPITYMGRAAIIIATTDITELIEKDAQIIQAAKMKSLGEMSAGVAHELNQPLNAIQLACELLDFHREKGMEVPPDKMSKVLTSISGQVQRAKEIIDTLRSFGRKAEPFKKPLNLNGPIVQVLSIIRKQFELDNIRFQLDLDENLPTIMAQDNRMQQVFFNLTNNARDAIMDCPREDASREIRIRTYAAKGKVVAEVADTGCGVPRDMRQKIFEPFFTTKEVGRGTGLGLAISYGIVRDYGGDVTIGEEPGGGAVFRVTFPTERAAA